VLALADVGLDRLVVIAFGAEQGGGVLSGQARPATGVYTIGGRSMLIADGAFDLGAQRLVADAFDAGAQLHAAARRGCGDGRRETHGRNHGEGRTQSRQILRSLSARSPSPLNRI
jgi:hypothetical protein